MQQFKEYLARLQGLERTEIPQEVIHTLLMKFDRMNINPRLNPEAVTYKRVRGFLQEDYSHFFENTVKIISKLTGIPPRVLTPAERDELIQRFQDVQAPYERYKGTRKNFLSYAYVTYKFCELLGLDEFLDYLPLLKAPQNLLRADRIWEKICRDCEYPYIFTDSCLHKSRTYGEWV